MPASCWKDVYSDFNVLYAVYNELKLLEGSHGGATLSKDVYREVKLLEDSCSSEFNAL